jgi:hypothetical protein
MSEETGRFEIFPQSLPVRTGRWQVSTIGARRQRWSRDRSAGSTFRAAMGGQLWVCEIGDSDNSDSGNSAAGRRHDPVRHPDLAGRNFDIAAGDRS